MSDTEGGKIVFKKISRKNLRRKVSDDEDDNEETISSIKNKLEETKMKQKLRERASGVNAICLALGEKVSEEILKVTVRMQVLLMSKFVLVYIFSLGIEFLDFINFTIIGYVSLIQACRVNNNKIQYPLFVQKNFFMK